MSPDAARSKRIIIVFVLLALAILIRGRDLGRWCFTTDEFYLYRAESSILEHGVPRFPGGGYYARGIGLQYLSVLPVLAFPKPELAIRFLPFLFGVLSIPLFYRLCLRYLPDVGALLCTLVLLLSSWHVEMSRFGRFYAPFQALFLLFLFFYLSGYWENNRLHQRISWGIAFTAPFVYEGAIFLPLLLAAALLQEDSPASWRGAEILAVSLAIGVVCFLLFGIEYRNVGVTNALPPEIQIAGPGPKGRLGPILIPSLGLVPLLWTHKGLMLFYILIAGAGVAIVRDQFRYSPAFWPNAAAALCVLFPLVHQFALAGGVGAILLIGRDDIRECFRRRWIAWAVYLLAALAFWFVTAMLFGNRNQVLHELIGYPPFKEALLIPFSRSVPIWGLLVMAAIGASTLRHIWAGDDKPGRSLSVALLLCLLAFPFFHTPYRHTRYVFFLLPLVLLVAFREFDALARAVAGRLPSISPKRAGAAAAMVPFFLFFGSDDFHWDHLRAVSAAEANFRTGRYSQYEHHWQERFDYETPAVAVNKLYRTGDQVVIDSIPFSTYLSTPYVFYSSPNTRWYHAFSRNAGREEIWTGHPMISKLPVLGGMAPIEPERNLWLIATDWIGGVRVEDLAREYGLSLRLRHEGIDGRFKVWQLQREKRERAHP
jgi:hypothetical protein